jgi:hypothetical protein
VGAALYGILIGTAFVALTRLAPQPNGSVVYWAFFTLQLSWGAVTCWRRTGLQCASAAMAVGGVISASLAALAATGRVFPDVPPAAWLLLGSGVVVVPGLLWLESRVNPVKWRRWARYMQQRNSLWDILTGRHIPQLRNGGA